MLEELTIAVFSMANSKSLGPDGVTTELFKAMWLLIESEYCQILTQGIVRDKLPTWMIAGVIILLHKGGNKSLLSNWRPIMLLNKTYKIFAKILQMELQPILMEIISVNLWIKEDSLLNSHMAKILLIRVQTSICINGRCISQFPIKQGI